MAAELFGAGGFLPYAAAKGGIDVLTIGLGKEAGAEGIRVAGLRPGLIDTEMQDDTGIENRIARFGPTAPLGRAGTALEVAEAAVWLLSGKASYVTATIFNVAGGR
jgi:NAD(P)-dependent dehydrogenase (short-subunit alcohol dehydrogenase family)